MTCVFGYMTINHQDSAEELVTVLVKERLVACANILSPGISIYEWNGKVVKETEVGVILKTSTNQLANLKQRIIDLHPYETPCFVTFPITDGATSFLAWVQQQTKMS